LEVFGAHIGGAPGRLIPSGTSKKPLDGDEGNLISGMLMNLPRISRFPEDVRPTFGMLL